jgi:copper chaperone NosL
MSVVMKQVWTSLIVVLAVVVSSTWVFWQGRRDATVPGDVCLVAPLKPYDPASGLSRYQARPVPADARCPVCGMFPARSRPWAAQVIFKDGDVHYLDSPLSLFMYLHEVERYSRGRHLQDIAARYVSDTRSGQWLDADKAFYVHGSDALGPMRSGNLPAFATEAQGIEFALQHGGQLMTAVALGQELPGDLARLAPHGH